MVSISTLWETYEPVRHMLIRSSYGELAYVLRNGIWRIGYGKSAYGKKAYGETM